MEKKNNTNLWVLPYIDQPLHFWKNVKQELGNYIKQVYFPIQLKSIGSGRPMQPNKYLESFLKEGIFPLSTLINPIVLKRPIEGMWPPIKKEIKRLYFEYSIKSITVTNITLGRMLKQTFPDIELSTSVLTDIYSPSR